MHRRLQVLLLLSASVGSLCEPSPSNSTYKSHFATTVEKDAKEFGTAVGSEFKKLSNGTSHFFESLFKGTEKKEAGGSKRLLSDLAGKTAAASVVKPPSEDEEGASVGFREASRYVGDFSSRLLSEQESGDGNGEGTQAAEAGKAAGEAAKKKGEAMAGKFQNFVNGTDWQKFANSEEWKKFANGTDWHKFASGAADEWNKFADAAGGFFQGLFSPNSQNQKTESGSSDANRRLRDERERYGGDVGGPVPDYPGDAYYAGPFPGGPFPGESPRRLRGSASHV